MRIAPELVEEIVAHAREGAPNECCGLVSGREREALSVRRAPNLFASPRRFEVGGLPGLLSEIEADGEEMIGMYHSHPRSEAYPSQTDINLAWGWPGILWLICSLAGDEPEVRCFEITDARVDEVELEIAGA
ncbi:MAG: M67 family metallopeptidase [bacterium]